MDRLQVSIPTEILEHLPEGASAEQLRLWVLKQAQAAAPGRDLRLEVILSRLLTQEDVAVEDDPAVAAGHLLVVVGVQVQEPLTDDAFSELMRGFKIPPWVVPYDGLWPNKRRQSFEAYASVPLDGWMA